MSRDRRDRRQDRPGEGIEGTTRYLESMGSLAEWEASDLVRRADRIGRELARDMTTSQIRNFLDEVNRLEAEVRQSRDGKFDNSRVVLLKPLLAYAAGRESGSKREVLRRFAELFSAAIEGVETREDFQNFYRFTQAVVAYHRYHGGSNQ